MPPSAPDAWSPAGCLLLILLCASTSTQAPAAKMESHISSPLQHQPSIGQKLYVPCKGHTIFPESGIMYWLANETFVDELYPDGAVKEAATVEKDGDLTRELIFYSFTEQDFHTKFECIILDPSGVVQKIIKWDYKDAKGGGSRAPRD